MTTRAQFQQFVDRHINDPKFREDFEKDKAGAVESMGWTITPEIKKALDNLDMKSLRDLGTAMGPKDCC